MFIIKVNMDKFIIKVNLDTFIIKVNLDMFIIKVNLDTFIIKFNLDWFIIKVNLDMFIIKVNLDWFIIKVNFGYIYMILRVAWENVVTLYQTRWQLQQYPIQLFIMSSRTEFGYHFQLYMKFKLSTLFTRIILIL